MTLGILGADDFDIPDASESPAVEVKDASSHEDAPPPKPQPTPKAPSKPASKPLPTPGPVTSPNASASASTPRANSGGSWWWLLIIFVAMTDNKR